MSGCEDQQQDKQTSEKIAAAPFILGLIPEQDLFSQKKRYEPLADYLSAKAGVAIELKILSRYGNIIENFVVNELDGAFFGSFTGALAIRKLGIQPIARPEWEDGTSTYYGIIFVRKDSGINTVEDMKGKRFAWVDKSTTAGWLFPLHYFKDANIADPHTTFLKECYFTGTHEDAILDVLDGKADIGAAKDTVFYRLAKKDKRVIEELQILAESPKVPANSLGLAPHVDKALKDRLTRALLEMADDSQGRDVLAKFGARRFITTTKSDYDPVFSYAEQAGIDLQTYDYIND